MEGTEKITDLPESAQKRPRKCVEGERISLKLHANDLFEYATGGTQGCGDSLGRGNLPQVETPSAQLFGRGSSRVCRSPDQAPPRPYARCVGRPAFIVKRQGSQTSAVLGGRGGRYPQIDFSERRPALRLRGVLTLQSGYLPSDMRQKSYAN